MAVDSIGLHIADEFRNSRIVEYGDFKQSIVLQDHKGWVLLDGRDIATLTTTQQSILNGLGLIALPDATNCVLMQNGLQLASVNGSNEVVLFQDNLPSIDLFGSTDTNTHAHDYLKFNDTGNVNRSSGGAPTQKVGNDTISTTNTDTHSHSVTVALGGANIPIDITPKTLSINNFIYLGA